MKIETHSIEFVPLSERYGTSRRLFTIWFSSNLQVTALVVGSLGVVAGLGLPWVILAIVLGNLIGGVFMAGHSAQGPSLGIPQMIQSRAQFGVIGAGIPLFIVVVSYVLFTAANGVIMRDAVKSILPIGDNWAISLFGIVTLAIAFFGYELIHRFGIYMTFLSAILFVAVVFLVLGMENSPVEAPGRASVFVVPAFLLAVTQAASWSLGFGPYVADYSRYLPHDVSGRATFWYSFGGQVIGASSVMIVGALIASVIPAIIQSPALGIAQLFGNWSYLALLVVVLGVIEINVLNLYSAYMSALTIVSGFKGMTRVSSLVKFLVMLTIITTASLIAIITQHDFGTYFTDILIAQIYFLVPWSAINLADFYLVRHGRYVIDDIFDEGGIYGRYNMPTLAIYFVTVVAQLPFMDLSFYKGPAALIIGTDMSWVVALVLPIVLYAFLFRSAVARGARQTAN